ncbi:unnamed protein product [Rhizophagus irregularis]|nr:unnamed protein product [Rhizophagus irregularis]
MTGWEETKKYFDEKFNQINKKIGESNKNIDEARTDIRELFKRSIRSELTQTYGPHYTSNFEIFDLYGLEHFVSPRTHFSYENPTFDNQACITEFRVNKIANFIYEHKTSIV